MTDSLSGVRHRSLPVALLVSLRPRQWLKNVLVFAAPLAATPRDDGAVGEFVRRFIESGTSARRA